MIERLYQQVSSLSPRRLILGYSGGVDSQVLLQLLYQIKQRQTDFPDVLVVHVNHGLQEEADRWQQFCQQQCEQRDFTFLSEKLKLEVDSNIEEQARVARFSVFEKYHEPGDVVLLAHHANDQAETLLYRLFRGAGVVGLSAMKVVSEQQGMKILRPLLGFSREKIETYAEEQGLGWIEDSSNHNQNFDRNYIRSSVLPVISKRWPSAVVRMNKTATFLSEANGLLNELAQSDYSLHQGDEEFSLNLKNFEQLSLARKKNLIRYWCSLHGERISEKGLQELLENVIEAACDKTPLLQLENNVIQRFKQQLFIGPGDERVFESFVWRDANPCVIKGVGSFELQGANVDKLLVRPRQGGERITLVGAKSSKALKNWLQEQGIPPWQRSCLPLFYYQGQLVAVANLLVTQEGKELLGDQFFIKKN